ncbi:MAG: hypothetical protein FWG10_07675 [Eubacteriaceae bacterium]|nr:hypothetical protein [Eubacteriaceae bacterium]
MKFIDKIMRKFPRVGIENLITHVIAGTVVVYMADFAFNLRLSSVLWLDFSKVLSGQVWRLLTFVLIPEESNFIFFALMLSFQFFIGKNLESFWGTNKFTFYYIFSMLCTILASVIFPGMYNGYYINLSLFIAFAVCFPEFQINYMMFIPLKAKYLLVLYLAIVGITAMRALGYGQWNYVMSIIASLATPILFFWPDFRDFVKRETIRAKHRRKYR